MRTDSLRDLCWLLLLSAVLAGWYAHARRHRRERMARLQEFTLKADGLYRTQVESRRTALQMVQEEKKSVMDELQQIQKQFEILREKEQEFRSETLSRRPVSTSATNDSAFSSAGLPSAADN
jgi:hypothetical protein